MSSGAPTVLILTLGGTIASLPAASGGEGGPPGGAVPALSAADLVASVPGLQRVARIEARSVRQIASCEITPLDVLEVAVASRAALEPNGDDEGAQPVTGVVVVQGTDTLEETAFLLDVLHDGPEPIVVTGAMRTPDTPGADGPANLLAAATVAADPAARNLGAMVVMADEIHAARWVHKVHTSATGAFASPGLGPLGRVIEGRVRIDLVPAARTTTIDLLGRSCAGDRVLSSRWPVIPILRVAQGTLCQEVEALAAIADGLVVEGVGGGHVPSSLVETLQRVAERIPVVLAARPGAGGTLQSTYGYPGSEIDLLRRGVGSAGDLDALKARLWLGADILMRRTP